MIGFVERVRRLAFPLMCTLFKIQKKVDGGVPLELLDELLADKKIRLGYPKMEI